jgi:hypothetical protein
MAVRSIGVIVPVSVQGMTLIATATPSASTSLSFTGIPGIYKDLLVIWRGVFTSTPGAGGWNVRFNGDSGSNYGYSSHAVRNGSSVVEAPSSTSTLLGSTADTRGSVIPQGAADASIPGRAAVGNLKVYRYAQLEPRIMESTSSQQNTNDGPLKSFVSGVYNSSSSAITSIEFIRTGSQTITGTFYLYGVA